MKNAKIRLVVVDTTRALLLFLFAVWFVFLVYACVTNPENVASLAGQIPRIVIVGFAVLATWLSKENCKWLLAAYVASMVIFGYEVYYFTEASHGVLFNEKAHPVLEVIKFRFDAARISFTWGNYLAAASVFFDGLLQLSISIVSFFLAVVTSVSSQVGSRRM
jgi:hypothetical protein